MNVVYLAKHKCSAARSLQYLVERGCDVRVAVVPEPDAFTGDNQRVDTVAAAHGIPVRTDHDLDTALAGDDRVGIDLTEIDLVISFLFWKRIRPPLLDLGRLGSINFHPAPLPDFRGVGGYNVAIWEGLEEWGVSAHFVDAEFDTGDLIAVDRFAIDPATETALSLDRRSQRALETLFRRVIDIASGGAPLPRSRQSDGRYVTKREFEALRAIQPGDGPAEIDRRIRAFWYPPYDGATIELGGQTLTLVDRARLEELAGVYRDAGEQP